MKNKDAISVIVPCLNEEKYIDICIKSILEQDYPKENTEVFFVDGMSTDKTRHIIKHYVEKYPYIKLLDNEKKIVPYALNKGIENSAGNIIIRLDAHTIYPSNYFSVLVSKLEETNADNVGVACLTDVLNKTPRTLAIKEVLSNKFGVGNSLFRLGVKKITEVDTVPFGCYNKDVFDKYGLYNVDLTRNQDIELNKRIKNNGGKILLIPDIHCTYYARETFSALAKNNYQNGKWNILTVFYTKMFNSLSIRHFIPLSFLLSVLLPSILGLIYYPFIFISIASLFLYLFFITVLSGYLSITKKLNFFYLVFSFMTLHFSYGFGSLVGIIKLPYLKLKQV